MNNLLFSLFSVAIISVLIVTAIGALFLVQVVNESYGPVVSSMFGAGCLFLVIFMTVSLVETLLQRMR